MKAQVQNLREMVETLKGAELQRHQVDAPIEPIAIAIGKFSVSW